MYFEKCKFCPSDWDLPQSLSGPKWPKTTRKAVKSNFGKMTQSTCTSTDLEKISKKFHLRFRSWFDRGRSWYIPGHPKNTPDRPTEMTGKIPYDHTCTCSTCIFGGLCFLFDCLDRGVFVCCFVWLFRSGCFVWGVVCCCWGGGMRRLFFLKSCTRNLRYYKSPELGLNLSGS